MIGTLRFAEPWALLGLILVAAVVVLDLRRGRRGLDPAARAPSTSLLGELPGTLWLRLRRLPEVLRWLALTMVVLALARPQTEAEPDEVDTEGIDIMIALDVSGSMRAADFQPRDRMFVAKKSVSEFIAQRSRDRVGLVIFAGEATLWSPLTLDYGLLLELLSEVEVGVLPDGTAIGTALGTALAHLEESDAESRVVVLLTDGENNAGSLAPRQAASMAEQLDVPVYTVAIGTDGVVPFPGGTDLFGRKVMRQVQVQVDRELLEELADRTGGRAFSATDAEELDAGLSQVLDSLDRSVLQAGISERAWKDRWGVFLLASLLLLLLEGLLASTRLRRFP